MLKRVYNYFAARDPEDAPAESRQLEKEGYVILRQVFSDDEVAALHDDIMTAVGSFSRSTTAAAISCNVSGPPLKLIIFPTPQGTGPWRHDRRLWSACTKTTFTTVESG